MKRIILTEEQLKMCVSEKTPIDPKKVLYVKNFLDSHFKRGKYGNFSGNGDWENIDIVSMVDGDGNPVKNMTVDGDLFQYLQSKFNEEKHLYGDRETCDRFLKMIIPHWYNNEITRLGQIKGKNYF